MNPTISKDQATSILQRIVYGAVMFFAMKAVAKGWIDADMAAYLAVGIASSADTVYAWWTNRPKALQIAAANTGAVVITSKEIADATPNSPNVVSTVAEAKDAIANQP